MTLRCAFCKSSNYGRHDKFRTPSPLGSMILRWHACSECGETFVSAERVLTPTELDAYADALQEQIRGR